MCGKTSRRAEKRAVLLKRWERVCPGLLFGLAVATYVWFAFVNRISVDEREHLSASYMIYRGLVPYQDFFEHHHPLMWYMFAPLFHIWGNDANIWYVVRGVMLGVAAGTGYYIHKLGRLFGLGGKEALIGVAIWLSLPGVLLTGNEFRPDNWMMMFFMAGMAYFFEYLHEKRRGLLQLAFGLFFLSLLCLQKAVVLFVPLGAVCLWLLYRREMAVKDFMAALWFPLGMTAALLAWLYFTGGLKDYWELNWLLNLKIRLRSILSDGVLLLLWCGAAVAAGVMWFYRQREVRLFCLMYIALVMGLCFYRPWYLHYLLIYYPFLAVILGLALRGVRRWKSYRVWLAAALVAMSWQTFTLAQKYRDNFYRCAIAKIYLQYILDWSDADDLVLSDWDIFVGDLRRPAQGYYWFSLGHMATLDYRLFRRHELPDLDKIIKIRRPKVVANGFWRDCSLGIKYAPNRDCPFWDKVDRAYLEKNYDSIGFVYVRKD